MTNIVKTQNGITLPLSSNSVIVVNHTVTNVRSAIDKYVAEIC